MKIVQINSVCGVGSTGRICAGIAEVARENGHECKIAYGRSQAPSRYADLGHRICGDFEVKKHALGTRLFDKTGTYTKNATKKFLSWLNEYSPDILHLHNLHGYYINFPLLFEYIKNKNIRTVWTLHDCWAFTGHCAYFDMANCDKWKTGCGKCVQKSTYPKSFADSSAKMYALKKACFTGVKNMTVVTPSEWLAKLVKQSFLSEYDVRVINNGIDTQVFRPVESNVRQSLGIDGKKMILGVAFLWDERKGMDVFTELAGKLNDDYRIVLVGVDADCAKKLPPNIITIERTNSRDELAKLYSAADVFVNPTRQENFPTVNLEALACGTPVVTFDTGGSGEIPDACSGIVVPKNDTAALENSVIRVCEDKPFSVEDCVNRSKLFDYKDKFMEYVDMYSMQRGEL